MLMMHVLSKLSQNLQKLPTAGQLPETLEYMK